MKNTITFSITTIGNEYTAQETFTLEELNINPNQSQELTQQHANQLFEKWLHNHFAFSITINKDK